MKDQMISDETQLDQQYQNKPYHTLVQDVVDSIYQESGEEFKDNIKLLEKHVKLWVAHNEEPPNLDVSIMTKKEQIQRFKERQEAQNPQREDMHKIIEDQTKDICQKYGIKIKQFQESIGYQIDRFCNNDNAFLYFKKKATVDRLLKDQNEYQELSKRNQDYQKRMEEEYSKPQLKQQSKSKLENFTKAAQQKYLLKQQSQSMLDDFDENRTMNTQMQFKLRPKNNFTTLKNYQGESQTPYQKLMITNDSKQNFHNLNTERSFSSVPQVKENIKLPNFSNSYQVSPRKEPILMAKNITIEGFEMSPQKIKKPYKVNGKSMSVDHSIKQIHEFHSTNASQLLSPKLQSKEYKIDREESQQQSLPNIKRSVINFSNYNSQEQLLQLKKSQYMSHKRSMDVNRSPDSSRLKTILNENSISNHRSHLDSLDQPQNQETQVQLNIQTILQNCKIYEDNDKLALRNDKSPIDKLSQRQLNSITQSDFLSPKKYNFIDEQLLHEKLKAENLLRLSKDLKKLQHFKPQLLKAFYKESKNSYIMECETEKQCTEQYMIKKMDTRIQKMLEFKTKKR